MGRAFRVIFRTVWSLPLKAEYRVGERLNGSASVRQVRSGGDSWRFGTAHRQPGCKPALGFGADRRAKSAKVWNSAGSKSQADPQPPSGMPGDAHSTIRHLPGWRHREAVTRLIHRVTDCKTANLIGVTSCRTRPRLAD